MSPRVQYKSPPVTEVVCEVVFRDSDWDLSIPGQMYGELRDAFPQKREVNVVQAQVSFGPGGQSALGLSPLQGRMQFLNGAGDRVLQVGQDLLAFNKLPPYTQFEDWEQDFHRGFELYRRLATPGGIQSLTLRYLNRIRIPGRKVLIQEHFSVYPHLPSSLEEHGPFMVRFEVLRAGHKLVITLASAPSHDEEASTFVLDLVDICPGLAFESIDEQLHVAHDNLWQTFEESCTEALKGTFEPEARA